MARVVGDLSLASSLARSLLDGVVSFPSALITALVGLQAPHRC